MAHETIHLGPGDHRTRNKFLGHDIRRPSHRALFVGALSVSGALALGGSMYALSQQHETHTAVPAGNAPEAKKLPKVAAKPQGLIDLPLPKPPFKDLAPGQTSLSEKHGQYGVVYMKDHTTQVVFQTKEGIWEETWTGGIPQSKDMITCKGTTALLASVNFENGAPTNAKDAAPVALPGSPACKNGHFDPAAAGTSGGL